MKVKGREPVLMLDGKAANRALPKGEGAKPGGANTATFFTSENRSLGQKLSSFIQLRKNVSRVSVGGE